MIPSTHWNNYSDCQRPRLEFLSSERSQFSLSQTYGNAFIRGRWWLSLQRSVFLEELCYQVKLLQNEVSTLDLLCDTADSGTWTCSSAEGEAGRIVVLEKGGDW